jgi:hypothetical protein
VNVTALMNSSSKVKIQIHFVLNEKTFLVVV